MAIVTGLLEKLNNDYESLALLSPFYIWQTLPYEIQPVYQLGRKQQTELSTRETPSADNLAKGSGVVTCKELLLLLLLPDYLPLGDRTASWTPGSIAG